MFDYGTPTYLRAYGEIPTTPMNPASLQTGYWYHTLDNRVYVVDYANLRGDVIVAYDPDQPTREPHIVSGSVIKQELVEYGRFYGDDKAGAIAQSKRDKPPKKAPVASKPTAPKAPAAPKSPAAPAAPTYVPVPTSPSTALVPAPGKTGGATAGLTQKPWFWPAVAGGGILALLGLYAALRGKKGSKKATAPAAPATPASRFKF